jgi:hypothetical protein
MVISRNSVPMSYISRQMRKPSEKDYREHAVSFRPSVLEVCESLLRIAPLFLSLLNDQQNKYPTCQMVSMVQLFEGNV